MKRAPPHPHPSPTGFIDFTPITHANHVRTRKQNPRFRILAAAARAQTAAERLTIFTLINSVNKACRGRIYTHDYIGLIKKRGKKSRGSRWRRRVGLGTGSLLETHIDTDGGEQGFIWDYLTAYTHTATVYTHTHTHTNVRE